jgi:hypothetical protein
VFYPNNNRNILFSGGKEITLTLQVLTPQMVQSLLRQTTQSTISTSSTKQTFKPSSACQYTMHQCHLSRKLFLNSYGAQVLVHKIPSFSILRTTNSLSFSPLTILLFNCLTTYFIGIAPQTRSVTSCSGLWTDLRPL